MKLFIVCFFLFQAFTSTIGQDAPAAAQNCPAVPQQHVIQVTSTCNCHCPSRNGEPELVTEEPETTVFTTTIPFPEEETTTLSSTSPGDGGADTDADESTAPESTTTEFTTTTTEEPEIIPPDTLPVSCDRGLNLAVVLDGSANVWPEDFARAKEFVKSLSTAFQQPTNNFSLVVYGDAYTIPIYLNNAMKQDQINDTVDSAAQPQGAGAANTHMGISAAADQLVRYNPERKLEGPRKMLVLTASYSSQPQQTRTEAAEVKRVMIESFSIGVGPYVYKQELTRIAGDKASNVRRVKSFAELGQFLEAISLEICHGTF